METVKVIKTLSLLTAIILNITMLLIYLFTQINYVPKEEINKLQSKFDSLVSLKVHMEHKLNIFQTLEKENKLNRIQTEKMQRNMVELKKHIINYQSQMRSLLIENEKLEIKILRVESGK